MQVKSKEQVIFEKIYDLFKEIFHIEDDEEDDEEIKEIIFKTNKDSYVLEFNIKIIKNNIY